MSTARNTLWLLRFLLLALITLSGGHLALAQINFGGIVGTVTDPSGAAISDAQVTAANTATSVAKTATTGSSGTYSFNNLNPGSYAVTVAHPGFNSSTQDAVDVTIGGSARVDATLPVGDVATNVTVQASSTQLQTDSPRLAASSKDDRCSSLRSTAAMSTTCSTSSPA